MSGTQSRVQSIIDRFVIELTTVAREEAARVVLGGLGGSLRPSTGPTRNGHQGAKRSSESLALLEEKLVSFVAKHPGLRVEQINKELGTSTKDLALPIKKLIAGRRIRAEGARRATKYFTAGKKTLATAAKKTKRSKRSKR